MSAPNAKRNSHDSILYSTRISINYLSMTCLNNGAGPVRIWSHDGSMPDMAWKAYDGLGKREMRLRIVVAESRAWRWLERIAVMSLGLAILITITGIVFTRTVRLASTRAKPAAPAGIPAPHVASVPAVPPAEQPVAVPAPSPKVPDETAKAAPEVAVPPQSAGERHREVSAPPKTHGTWLRGRDPVVVVAATEADAAELRRHPNKLVDLIKSGSLFSVPNNSAVAVAVTDDGLVQVHVLDGASRGKDGWVPANRVVRQ